MAENVVAAQKPIMQEGTYYYPLTTAKQIILPDGRRLGSTDKLNLTADDVDALSIDTSNVIQGEAAPSNADSLGGYPASYYIKVDDKEDDSVANVVKAQSFLTHGDTSILPITSADQIVVGIGTEDEHRLEQNGKIIADIADNALMLENKTINELYATIFEIEHPIGSIYLSSSDADNPNTKWAALGIVCAWELVPDVFLLGSGNLYELEETGGEAEHTLTKDELPNQSLRVSIRYAQSDLGTMTMPEAGFIINSGHSYKTKGATWKGGQTWFGHTEVLGSGMAHNNMPPYLAVNIWKRIS